MATKKKTPLRELPAIPASLSVFCGRGVLKVVIHAQQ